MSSATPLWLRVIPRRVTDRFESGERPQFYGTVGHLGGDDRIGQNPKGRAITGLNLNSVAALLGGAAGLQTDDGQSARG